MRISNHTQMILEAKEKLLKAPSLAVILEQKKRKYISQMKKQ